MDDRGLNKSKLRDETCDTCYFSVYGVCQRFTSTGGPVLPYPKEHTCEFWKKQKTFKEAVRDLHFLDAEEELTKDSDE